MRQRRPLLALLAAAIVIPLTGLVATSAQAADPLTLRDPIKREIAQEIITSAENSVLDWYNRYDYIEDIKDGRGYTGGIIGFTSGTSDMLELVERYTKKYPNNGLAKYLPALRNVDGSDSHAGLGTAYENAWKAEGKKSEFQRAQRDLTREWYFDPSVDLAVADKIGPLGQFAYYDAAVVHGFDGMEDIRREALKKAKTPAQGGNETAYLNAFLDARVVEMKKEEAHEDVSRIENAQRVWLRAGNLNLNTPLSWSVYGDPFSIPTDPTPRWPLSELGGGSTPTPTPTPTDPGTQTLISKGKPVTTSSSEGSGYDGAKAVDGSATSRWASVEGVDPQWIRIDLGAGSIVNKVVLKWEAAYASKYRVEISADGSSWTTLATEAAGNGGTDEFTNLTGTGRYLRIYGTARGTAYGYSLFEVEAYGTAGTTTPNPGTAFTVVAAGDIAGKDCTTRGKKVTGDFPSDCKHFETFDRAQAIDPAFYITLGDMQYDDANASDFTSVYAKSWGAVKGNTWPIPGNHETYDDWDNKDPKAYRDYFGSRATPQGKMYYSYDYGNWHFVALDSNTFSDKAQIDWLAADLAANTKQCVVAYMHHPAFSSGDHGNEPASQPVWKMLANANVELVLSGHDHDYERFNPMNASGAASASGTVQIVSGLGGHEMRDFGNTKSNSAKRINTAYGVSQLDFTDTTVTQKFVDISGNVLDSTTITCH